MKSLVKRRPSSLVGVFAACALSLLVGGCLVVIVSGPFEVTPGEFATFELRLSDGFGFGATDVTLVVVAEVPDGWNLVSSEFEGTVNGFPVSGSAVETMDSYCDGSLGPERPGMQRISVIAGPFAETSEFDEGTATLQFQAVEQPAGEFKIAFVFGGGDDSPGDESCSGAKHRTINRDGRLISFIQALFDDQDVPTLELANSIEVTPDGQHVVATAIADNALNLFSRDAMSGGIAFVQSLVDNVGGVDGLDLPVALEISPEGNHVFVAAATDESIATFELDEGQLSFVSAVYDGVGGVTGLSSLEDLELFGSYVYAGNFSNGVTVFERNLLSGELTFVQEFQHEQLSSAVTIAVSPDGKNLYAGDATTSLVTLEIDPSTGMLSFVEELFGDGPHDLAMTGDGLHLYTMREDGSSLRVYSRDVTSGLLTLLDAYDLSDVAPYIGFLNAIMASHLDGTLFVADDSTVSVFVQRPDGSLVFHDAELQGDGPVEGIPEVLSMALSPDGEHLYTASRSNIVEASGYVAAFVAGPAYVFTDGFESGDTSAWSSTVP